MTPVELSRTVLRAVRRAVDEGELRVAVPERVLVTVPGPGGCGDYATNIALQLARPAGQTPRHVAEILRPHLVGVDGVTDVVVTGPGFINFRLRGTAPTALVEEILRRGPRYGFADVLSGQVVQLHCPHEVRAVVVMEAVCRLLRSQGVLVRTSCEAPPEPAWEDVLGVRVDACGRPGAPAPLDVSVRPVPAPADPLPLGRDAARWALLHPAAHDRPRLTDEHLVQREANPLFRVRYAHARTRATTRNAADLGFSTGPRPADAAGAAARPRATPGNAADLGFTAAPVPTDAAGAAARPRATPGNAADLGFTAAPVPTDAAGAAARPRATPGNAADLGFTAAPVPTDAADLAGSVEFPEAHAPAADPGFSAVPAPTGLPEAHAPAADPGFSAVPAPTGLPEAHAPVAGLVAPTGLPDAHALVAGLVAPTGLPEAHALVALLADYPRVLAVSADRRTPDRLARHLVTVADAALAFLPAVLPRGAEKPSAAHRARLALAEAAGTVLAGGLSLLGIDAPEHL